MPIRTRIRTRWIVAVVGALLAAAVVSAAILGRTRPAESAPGGPHAGRAVAVDPHAGHDIAASPASNGRVQLGVEGARALGVTVVEAELGSIRREIRTTGHVAYDETRLTTITLKVSGFVERLHVDFTGQPVRQGQPLLEIYAPELVAAQEELLAAIRMEQQLRDRAAPAVIDRTAGLVEAARRRLLLWDISPAQLQEIERRGEIRRTLTLYAPFGGFVIEKMVQAGQAVEMGMPLYRLADLSTVWAEADVYENDLRFVRLGETAQVEIAAYPGEPLEGRVSYVYPEVRPETRTARIRIALANPRGRIMPGMFATISLDAPVSERAVLVPRDAVMHSGTHAMVFVEESPGTYRAREVRIGADAGARTQIVSGLVAGERVVKRANFLLDAESRLMDASMEGMEH